LHVLLIQVPRTSRSQCLLFGLGAANSGLPMRKHNAGTETGRPAAEGPRARARAPWSRRPRRRPGSGLAGGPATRRPRGDLVAVPRRGSKRGLLGSRSPAGSIREISSWRASSHPKVQHASGSPSSHPTPWGTVSVEAPRRLVRDGREGALRRPRRQRRRRARSGRGPRRQRRRAGRPRRPRGSMGSVRLSALLFCACVCVCVCSFDVGYESPRTYGCLSKLRWHAS